MFSPARVTTDPWRDLSEGSEDPRQLKKGMQDSETGLSKKEMQAS